MRDNEFLQMVGEALDDAAYQLEAVKKGYPTNPQDYGDIKNKKYPLNSPARVRSALSYWGNPKNREGYTASEIKTITNRIHQAAKKFGITVNPDDSK